jgi:PA14 domain
MHRVRRHSVLFLLFGGPWALAGAADLYVSGSGNDSAAGTSVATAFRTLGKAAALVNPGDTVWVLNGTYAPVSLSQPGAAGAPITWRAYAGHAPEIVNNGEWNSIFVGASYQVIDGLTLTGNNDHVTLAQAEADYADPGGGGPAYNGSGIALDNRNKAPGAIVHHLTVRNTTLRKFGCAGIAVLYADYIVIEHNQIYENAWYSRYGCSGATIFTANVDAPNTGATHHNSVSGNMMWNNRGLVKWKEIGQYSDGNGFILDLSAADYNGRTLIADNLAVHNGGSGIHAYGARHADIVNNTAYMNGDEVGYADIFAGSSTDITLSNNIAYARAGGRANTNDGNNDVSYNHNVYFNGSVAVMGAQDIVADPLFVNPGLDPRTADFRLRAGSPAIDTALVAPSVTPSVDIVGTTRPQGAGLDRGAYEFATAPSGDTTGWQATYFSKIDLTGAQVTRTDKVIDFNWGNASPAASIGADHFSARWRGQLTAPASGSYTLFTTTDDGVRLWVDGKLVIDQWFDQWSAEHAAIVTLTAGQPVLVVMEFYENAGAAAARLEWQSRSVARQVIPQTAVGRLDIARATR